MNPRVSRPFAALYLAEGASIRDDRAPGIHVKSIVSALSENGVNITLMTRGKTASRRRNDQERYRTILLPELRFPFSIATHLIGVVWALALIVVLRPSATLQRDSGVNLGMILSKMAGVVSILEVDGDLPLEMTTIGTAATRALGIAIHLSYGLADFIVVPSRGLMASLRKLGVSETKILLVPNGVDPDLFRPLDKGSCRSLLNLGKESLNLCFTGNLAPWQGLEVAFLAVSRFIESRGENSIRLIIAGAGPDLAKLQRLRVQMGLTSNVLFLGEVPHAQVPYIIGASDAGIIPLTAWRNNVTGASPLKLFEYLSCGRPVIASRVVGVAEVIERMGSGIVVAPDDAASLALAFEEATRRIHRWETEAEMFHSWIESEHSWNQRASLLLSILDLKLGQT